MTEPLGIAPRCTVVNDQPVIAHPAATHRIRPPQPDSREAAVNTAINFMVLSVSRVSRDLYHAGLAPKSYSSRPMKSPNVKSPVPNGQTPLIGMSYNVIVKKGLPKTARAEDWDET